MLVDAPVSESNALAVPELSSIDSSESPEVLAEELAFIAVSSTSAASALSCSGVSTAGVLLAVCAAGCAVRLLKNSGVGEEPETGFMAMSVHHL